MVFYLFWKFWINWDKLKTGSFLHTEGPECPSHAWAPSSLQCSEASLAAPDSWATWFLHTRSGDGSKFEWCLRFSMPNLERATFGETHHCHLPHSGPTQLYCPLQNVPDPQTERFFLTLKHLWTSRFTRFCVVLPKGQHWVLSISSYFVHERSILSGDQYLLNQLILYAWRGECWVPIMAWPLNSWVIWDKSSIPIDPTLI